MPEGESRDSLVAHIGRVRTELDSLRNEVRPAPPPIQGFRRNFTLGTDLGNAFGRVGSSSDPLTEGDEVALETVRTRVASWTAGVEAFYEGAAAELAAALREADVALLDLGG